MAKSACTDTEENTKFNTMISTLCQNIMSGQNVICTRGINE